MLKSKNEMDLIITMDVLRNQIKDNLQILDGIVSAGKEHNPLYVIQTLAKVLTVLQEAINKK